MSTIGPPSPRCESEGGPPAHESLSDRAYCSYAPARMAGLAMICLYDPKAGAQELERCAKLGLKGAMIWCSPPPEEPYSSAVYDPFWAAAQAMRMPVSLHSITGMGRESQWDFAD